MKRSIRYAVLAAVAVLLIITQTACDSEAEPVSKENYFLDTTCNITVYSTGTEDGESVLDEEKANKAIDEAYDVCRELEKKLSRSYDTSEISRINNAGGAWVEVSGETAEVLEKGLYYSELSDGAFDITIGTVTDLWDYHSDDPKVPDRTTIDEALRHVDYHNVEMDGRRVRLLDPDASIDLGGIAKGYIGDRMADRLEECGITSAIINLGGNVICVGTKPNADGFVIGVEKPYSDRTEIIGSLEAKNQTVVTSGIYERQFEVDGKIYHHILSTETGCPAETDVEAVTLVAAKGHSVDADAVSTICLIYGKDRALSFIEKMKGVEAVVSTDEDEIFTTSGMDFKEE